ncbi:MAG: glutamyl-tRNA reductase [Campylobacter sp.]|nr:glutamyl-tRNA reductase [Campylobacter sp.]
MQYLNVSFTHKNTDIAIRERLAFTDINKKREILRLIASNLNIDEVMVINTCNRVEIFAFVGEATKATEYIFKAISALSGVSFSALEERADIYEGSGAIHHMFLVASSLDSLVVGETQIVGQIKDAFYFAKAQNTVGINLTRAINFAFKTAAKVRNQTQISKNPVSVSSVAVSKAREIFGSFNGVNVLVVGAGEMSELTCKNLINAGANITLINRSQKRAFELKENLEYDIEIQPFDELEKFVNLCPVIFSATSANYPVITDNIIKEVKFNRYFFDIAVPRDISVSENEKIKVYSVDDLEEIVKFNLALREEQAQIAYSIVGKDTTLFFKYIQSLASTPIIKALRQKAKDTAESELEKAIKKGYLKSSDLEESRKLIHQVFKAFLHRPTINLKNITNSDESDTLKEIFELEIDEDDEKYSIENI